MTEKPWILLIEDDMGIASTIRILLSRDGYGVVHLYTHDEADSQLQTRAFALVITDNDTQTAPGGLRGAGLDWLETHMRGSNNAIPVIFTSGDGGEEIRDKAVQLGAKAFLPKPSSIEEIRALIRSVLSASQTPGTQGNGLEGNGPLPDTDRPRK